MLAIQELFNSVDNGINLSVACSGFEGVEKKLEIDFKKTNSVDGIRSIPKDRWDELLNLINCKIVSHCKNEYFDSYVLSESSLFCVSLQSYLENVWHYYSSLLFGKIIGIDQRNGC